jgi:hypothetical protein
VQGGDQQLVGKLINPLARGYVEHKRTQAPGSPGR